MPLYTVEQLSGRRIREGEFLTASAVSASNVLRDIREFITNVFGGRMRRYESLTDNALQRAITKMEEQAKAKGYDGVVAVRIAHPNIVSGSAGVVIYGTGFNFISDKV